MASVSSVPISGTVPAAITSTVDTAAPPPPNKAERPPLQHVETSGYTTASAPPGYAYTSDPEKGGSPKGNKTNVLRRQHPDASGSGILLREVDKLQGYREIPGGNGGKKPLYAHHKPNNFSLTSPDNTHVVLDEDIKKTKVSFNLFFFFSFWTFMHPHPARPNVRLPLNCVHRNSLVTLHRPVARRRLDSGYPFSHQVSQRNGTFIDPFHFCNFVINYSRPGQVWGVRLIWWSIWLTILWGGTFLVC